MIDVSEDFILSRLPIVGLAAYMIEVPQGGVASQSLDGNLPAGPVARMLSAAARNSRTLLPVQQTPAHYCWTFDSLKIFIASRPDGACLSLLVENNPTVQGLRIQETLQAFLDLPA